MGKEEKRMNDEKEYRKRIRQEKEKLQEVEIFTSVKFVRLLKSITRDITDGTFDNVTTSWIPEALYMGLCDGKRIEINAANVVTQSFHTWSLKSDSIVGTLGHECGHYNLTNFVLLNKYLDGILEGVWYPRPPAASNEQESVYLAQMKAYFQKKDRIALIIIKQAAGIIWNLLEDIYIEDWMCRKYPGSIRRGILQNRSRNGEWLPSLRKQIDMGYEELAIMTNLIAQYTFAGTMQHKQGSQTAVLSFAERRTDRSSNGLSRISKKGSRNRKRDFRSSSSDWICDRTEPGTVFQKSAEPAHLLCGIIPGEILSNMGGSRGRRMDISGLCRA